MMHTKTITDYSFKYMDDCRKIYYLTQNTPKKNPTFYNRKLYTTPFENRKGETMNVLLGYSLESACIQKINDLETIGKLYEGLKIETVPLKDFKYLSSALNIPLIVLLNSYCDVYNQEEHSELFYYFDTKRYSDNHSFTKFRNKN